MQKVISFDTETTGLPDWKSPSGGESQPHMVQLAGVVFDGESITAKPLQSMDVIIRPDGWEIPEELTEIHGISQELAMDVGIPEPVALEMFMEMWSRCDLRIAHNTTFDNRIIRIALKRYMPDYVSDETWKDRDLYFCTLVNAKKIMGGNSGHTLEEAYKHFTGKTMEGAHSAMPDALACMEIYFAIKKLM